MQHITPLACNWRRSACRNIIGAIGKAIRAPSCASRKQAAARMPLLPAVPAPPRLRSDISFDAVPAAAGGMTERRADYNRHIIMPARGVRPLLTRHQGRSSAQASRALHTVPILPADGEKNAASQSGGAVTAGAGHRPRACLRLAQEERGWPLPIAPISLRHSRPAPVAGSGWIVLQSSRTSRSGAAIS